METQCEFICLGGTTRDKISDTCISPDVCVTPTYAGYIDQVVGSPCINGGGS